MNQSVVETRREPIIGLTGAYFLLCALVVGIGAILYVLMSGVDCFGLGHGCNIQSPDQRTNELVMGIGGLVVAAIFAVATFGLFRRKTWARGLTLILLGVMLLLLVFFVGATTINGLGYREGLNFAVLVPSLIWIGMNGFAFYRFMTDENLRQVLST